MDADDVAVTAMGRADWTQVEAIYAAGIATGSATFESEVPTWEHFDSTRLQDHRLVAIRDGSVVGWAACVPVSSRPVYSGVVEHSVYVDPAVQSMGIGGRLLAELIKSSEAAGIWILQSSIFPENETSLRLHERHGFRRVGRRERIAQAVAGPWSGQWRDTILIERRSLN